MITGLKQSKIEVQSMKLSDLLTTMAQGNLQMPRFQREFVWPVSKTRALLDSMYKEYPIGKLFSQRDNTKRAVSSSKNTLSLSKRDGKIVDDSAADRSEITLSPEAKNLMCWFKDATDNNSVIEFRGRQKKSHLKISFWSRMDDKFECESVTLRELQQHGLIKMRVVDSSRNASSLYKGQLTQKGIEFKC